MKKFIVFCSSLLALNAFATTSPSELKLGIYQIAASLSTDCSNPQVLFSSPVAIETDFLTNPILGAGHLDPGTYNCIMITMDDLIKFKVLTTNGGGCTPNFLYTQDVCRNDGGNVVFNSTDLLDGTTTTRTTCLGSRNTDNKVSNKVTMYLRTNAVANGDPNQDFTSVFLKGINTANSVSDGGSTGPSVDSANGLKLITPFVVTESATGVFYVDAYNKVNDTDDCELLPPTFGFRD